MVITLAIIAVVSTFGVLGIKAAREEFKHQSAARLFASYVEKARADAVRRHAGPGEESSIETFGPDTTRYDITMDWGSGVVETRTFNLDDGLTFDVAANKVSFDWRGRISKAWVFQIRNHYSGINLPIDVSGSGDITVGNQHFPDDLIPSVTITPVSGDVESDPLASPTATPIATPDPDQEPTPPPVETDPDATPTPTPTSTPTPTPSDPGNGNGNGNGNNGNGNPNATPTPTPDSSGGLQCVSTISPNKLTLSQSDISNQSGSATFTMVNASGVRTISASQVGGGNSLNISVSLQRIDGSGSSVITVSTKNGGGNRGVFIVNVTGDPVCGSAQKLTVEVGN
jgi:hypothetical protein